MSYSSVTASSQKTSRRSESRRVNPNQPASIRTSPRQSGSRRVTPNQPASIRITPRHSEPARVNPNQPASIRTSPRQSEPASVNPNHAASLRTSPRQSEQRISRRPPETCHGRGNTYVSNITAAVRTTNAASAPASGLPKRRTRNLVLPFPPL